MRLIDADVLMDEIHEHQYRVATINGSVDLGMFTLGIQQVVDEAPTIEAEPVVRCGDCKWYKKSKRYGYYRCGNPCEGMACGVELMPYDYCSYGERRNGDG